MATTDGRTIALCMEIAEHLRAVAADEGQDIMPSERRELIEIAAEVERRAGQ